MAKITPLTFTRFQKIALAGALISAALSATVWYAVLHERRGDALTVVFLDIGQGDAAFIQAPNGNQMVIDGGPNATLLREIGKVMPFYDRTIDVLVVTNPDTDHYAGFIDLLKRYRVNMVIESGTKSESETYRAFERAVKEEGSKKVAARRGMSLVLDRERGISFDVIFPDKVVDSSKLSSNDGSLVARLIYASTSVMFTGDTTQKMEKRLLRIASTTLASTILKVAHHGSKTSSAREFVQAVAPKYAVISLGRNNKYKHPSPETIETLDSLYIPTLRTDQEGTILFVSDGWNFTRRQ